MTRQDTGDRLWGAQLREYREDAKMSRQRLAELVFVDAPSVSAWELGRCLPSLDSLGRLRSVFPTLPPVETSRAFKPAGNTSNHGGRAGEAGAFWAALAEVGASARSYAVKHVDVEDPLLGAGQILGREQGRALVMFNRMIKWMSDDQVAAIRSEEYHA